MQFRIGVGESLSILITVFAFSLIFAQNTSELHKFPPSNHFVTMASGFYNASKGSPLDVQNYPVAPLGLELEQVHVFVRHGELCYPNT